MIAEIDQKLCAQVDEILHHPDFQKLESAWRGLKFARRPHRLPREHQGRAPQRLARTDLLADFEDAPEVTQERPLQASSTPPSTASSAASRTARSSPTTSSAPARRTSRCCRTCASVAAMAHAPFIAAAGPQFFGLERLPEPAEPEGPASRSSRARSTPSGNSFRETEDARYVGLTLPRFLLRLPYGARHRPGEDVQLRGRRRRQPRRSTCGATPRTRSPRALTDSFAKYRWCPNIIGPQAGGTVERPAAPPVRGDGRDRRPRSRPRFMLTERREFELSEEGFIGLTLPQGLRQRRVLLGQLGAEAEVLRQSARRARPPS